MGAKKIKFGWRICAINKLTKEKEWISPIGDYYVIKRMYDKFCKIGSHERPYIYPRMKYVPYDIQEKK